MLHPNTVNALPHRRSKSLAESHPPVSFPATEDCRSRHPVVDEEEYNKDIRKGTYVMYVHRGLDGEVVRTREDDTIASHIHDVEELISMLNEEMDHSLFTTHNLMTRKAKLEEELQGARTKHQEEIDALQYKFVDLKL
ncbi:hypothetical protein ZWY2020_005991 [Hordeum vulgare]|nr:hypothetical protein ZWY2020_005991 [Hordeum vulgare]